MKAINGRAVPWAHRRITEYLKCADIYHMKSGGKHLVRL